MKHKGDLAKGWLLKGDSDLVTAKCMIGGDGPYDTACFHAQQAAEKYLKAILAFHEVMIPRTHDLEELQIICAGFVKSADFSNLALDEERLICRLIWISSEGVVDAGIGG